MLDLLLSHNNFTSNVIAIILSVQIKKLEQRKQEILLSFIKYSWYLTLYVSDRHIVYVYSPTNMKVTEIQHMNYKSRILLDH